MDAPKCRTCHERHYGLCPGNSRRATSKSSRGGGESRPAKTGNKPGSVPGEDVSSSASRFVRPAVLGADLQPRAGVATSPREANPGAASAEPIPTVAHEGAKVARGGRTGGSTPPTGAKRKAGRPRIEDRDKTLAATKPWKALGMERATWYKRKAEGKL